MQWMMMMLQWLLIGGGLTATQLSEVLLRSWKSASILAILMHLGNQLVKDGVVTVKIRARLTVDDIVL